MKPRHESLRRSLEAIEYFYAVRFRPVPTPEEQKRARLRAMEKRLMFNLMEMERRITKIEVEEFGHHYKPRPYRRKDGGGDGGSDSGGTDTGTGTDSGSTGGGASGSWDNNSSDTTGNDGSGNEAWVNEPRIPAGQPGAGEWTSGGGGFGEALLAQEIPPTILMEEPPAIPNPLSNGLPKDPTIPPAPGFNEWRGPSQPGGPYGGWVNRNTGESLHPDMNNEQEGPHWDYNDQYNRQWRIWPDGSMTPKVIVGGITA